MASRLHIGLLKITILMKKEQPASPSHSKGVFGLNMGGEGVVKQKKNKNGGRGWNIYEFSKTKWFGVGFSEFGRFSN